MRFLYLVEISSSPPRGFEESLFTDASTVPQAIADHFGALVSGEHATTADSDAALVSVQHATAAELEALLSGDEAPDCNTPLVQM